MCKQAGFLEDHAKGAPVRWNENPVGLILPDRIAKGEQTVRCAFKSGHGAQAGRLARAGWTEQGADAAPRQGQVEVETEILAVDPEFRPNFAAHKALRRAGLKV